MSDQKKLVPFLSKPVVLAVATLAWTVMIGSAVARYMVAQGYIDENALEQRANNLKVYRDRILDAARADAMIYAEEGDALGEGDPPAAGPVSRKLGLHVRKATAENLLAERDPAVHMEEKTLVAEAKKALDRVRNVESLKGYLPYLSEGGLLLLLGIVLGMASKMVVKVVVVLALLLVGGMEYLGYQGVLEVDWGALAAMVKDTLLNITPHGDIAEILKEKTPSLASLAIGFFLGARS